MEAKPIETAEEYWAVREQVTRHLFTAESGSTEGRWAEQMMVFITAFECMNPSLRTSPDWIGLGDFLREFIEFAEGIKPAGDDH